MHVHKCLWLKPEDEPSDIKTWATKERDFYLFIQIVSSHVQTIKNKKK